MAKDPLDEAADVARMLNPRNRCVQQVTIELHDIQANERHIAQLTRAFSSRARVDFAMEGVHYSGMRVMKMEMKSDGFLMVHTFYCCKEIEVTFNDPP